jgi:primosomal protein N' (replication factor Y)
VLFIVPEISLTPQLVDRVEKALNVKAAVMHSNITPAKKRDAIFALLRGSARLLIGARSALFAPLKNLGLIVVDEEHDASLKQDEAQRYHARDCALWRARAEGARIVLGSATPSLESYVNVQKGKLSRLLLNDRYNQQQQLPKVTIIDLKERARDVDHRTKDASISAGQKMCILSRPLVVAIEQTLADNRQVLLFLNQRGYAKFGVCYQCGHTACCPNCSVGLTFYQNRRTLMCHQCQHNEVASTVCRHCHQDAVRFLGLGTERLEEEVRALFPEKIILRLDRDVVRSQQRLVTTLTAMHEQKAHILIGTQMIAKGHDFLHVGLVGVVCADTAFSLPDFRASEKTFQLLTQVAGRAGRGLGEGNAIIQTFHPEHPSIRFAKNHQVDAFVEEELAIRKHFQQPPYARAALIRAEHSDPMIAEDTMAMAKSLLLREHNIEVLGPAPSPIEKINKRFRFQCLLMAKDIPTLHRGLMRLNADQALTQVIAKKRMRFIIDVDPQQLC